MRKRIIFPVFILAVSLLFSSCTTVVRVTETIAEHKNNNSSNSITINKKQLDDNIILSPYYRSIVISNGYNSLETDSQRLCYNEILNHITSFTDKKEEHHYLLSDFTVYNCSITKRQLAQVFLALFEDNPQIFWLEETYAFSISENSVVIRLYSIMSKSRYKTCLYRLNAVINNILSSLKKGMSQFDRELYIHDYLVKNCKYKENADNTTITDPFTVYGALVNQNAVCQGYTKAFQLLLSYVGINSATIRGVGQNEEHIWNVAEIDDSWYCVDVTWDDSEDYCMYDYFNITEKQLEKSHTIDPMFDQCSDKEIMGDENNTPVNCNIFLPKCNSTKYNYYAYKGSNLKDMSNNTLAEDLAKAAKNNQEYFHIYVNPKYMNFTMTYDQLFSETVYVFSNYIEKANSILGENKIKSNVSVIKKKVLHTITVELNYA